MSEPRTKPRAWVVFGVGTLVYAAAVFQRASLGVAGIEAQRRFATTAAVLSLFSVLQLAVYAGLQIPVGALADRTGSRRLIITGATLMALGQLLLANADTVAPAIAARVLVGAGDAMTFISLMRLIPAWFAPGAVPVLTQLFSTLGQFGQVVAAFPLVVMLHRSGWNTSFTVAALIAVASGAIAAMVLRNAPPGQVTRAAPLGFAETRARIGQAWREPGTRLGQVTHFVTAFPMMVFALLWGYPFLVIGERRSPAEASLLLTLLVVVAMPIAPLIGHFARRWPHRRSAAALAIVAVTASLWTVVLSWPGPAPFGVLVVLVLVLACNAPGSVIGFDLARTENDHARLGSATGIVNVGGYVASLSAIGLIGLALSLQGASSPGVYTLHEFKLAFAVQYLFWALGVVGLLRIRRRAREARGLRLEPLHRVAIQQWRQRQTTR